MRWFAAEIVAWSLFGVGAALAAQAAVKQDTGLAQQRSVELQKLRAFDGTWRGDMSMTMQGKRVSGQASVNCRPAAGGWAELCTMTATLPGQRPYETVEVFSYDSLTDTYHWSTTSNGGQHLELQLAWASPTNARAHGQLSTPQGLIDDLATFHWRTANELEFQDVTTLDGQPYSSGEATFRRAGTAQSRSAPPTPRQRPPQQR